MAASELFVVGDHVATPTGVRPAALWIRDGVITRVADKDAVPAGAPVVDAGSALVMPGVVDTHVHVNEPGRTWLMSTMPCRWVPWSPK